MLRIRVGLCIFCSASAFGLLLFTAASAAPPKPAPPTQPAARIATDAHEAVDGTASVWMQWGAGQYALADDGAALWIGGGQGVLRWEKATGATRRYATPEGLPSRSVYAVAVDAAGNRWFGGDGGLSRLDPADQWTHFTPANSGIFSGTVTGIAVGADGTLWAGFAPPQAAVSRRDPDGAWHSLPDRASTVAVDYARILTTHNQNPLWTVAGNEVWVDYFVYNGTGWTDRTPDVPPTTPQQVVAAPNGTVSALDSGTRIWQWNGSAWQLHTIQFTWGGAVTAIAADAGSRLWLGIRSRDTGSTPYSNEQPELRILGAPGQQQVIAGNVPVGALLAEGSGVWATGPGWLCTPNGTVHSFLDTPAYSGFNNAIVDQAGAVWLQTSYAAPYTVGTMQRLDDRNTAVLEDDRWTRFGEFYLTRATALERAPGGDVWMAYVTATRFAPFLPDQPVGRYRQNTWYGYRLPDPDGVVEVHDIFAQDDRHTWFTFTRFRDGVGAGGVLRLDDGGTMGDVSDDNWTEYPDPNQYGTGTVGSVAVDSLGRLWYGGEGGLVRWDGAAWQPVAAGAICDLTPARDGIIFALVASTLGCLPTQGSALMVHPDNRVEHFSVGELVRSHLELVRTAIRPNRLWSVAREGAVWYLDGISLYRRDDRGVARYNLPYDATWMEAGSGGRVWLFMSSALWRLSPLPGLAVTPAPVHWLMAPGGHYAGAVVVEGIEGYSAPATLALPDLPTGITASWATAVVTPTQALPLTLTADANAGVGSYPFALHYTSGAISSTTVMTAVVADSVHIQILPEVHRE